MKAAMFAVLVLLAGFASQGGRATVTYQPTPLEGQGCPSDEDIAQVIENFHSLIEDRVEIESSPETQLLTELSTAVETLRQEVAELSNNSAVETLRQEVAELSNIEATILQTINGLNQALPAASCQQIFENRADLPSGHYWIRSSDGTVVRVYCDMARQCCNETTGGWTRVANLDMTDPSQQCPPAWTLITSPRRSCGRTTNGSFPSPCDSVMFQTNGITYSRVCGRIKAYQIGYPNAFWGYNTGGQTTIDSIYITGVSITHGTPRQHVWSFAVATYEQWSSGFIILTCPCTNTSYQFIANIQIPPFVGDDYFCETGTITRPPSGTVFFSDDPLWDGEGCGPTSTCCELNNPPWFCKQLPAPTSDDIEVRSCFIDDITNENTAIEQLELYVA